MSGSAKHHRVLAIGAGAALFLLGAIAAACTSEKHNITGPTSLAVSSVSPSSAVQNSPTFVRISGQGFQSGATVTIGGAATNVTVVGATTITATTQANAAGRVDVVVTNPDGISATLPGGFTFFAPIVTVTGVAPLAGLPGDILRVIGTNFQTGATVTVDGQPTGFSDVQSGTSILVEAPAHAAGVANLTVTNPDGGSATKFAAFTYQVVTLSVSASTVASGSPLSVSWVAPSGRQASDWIALYKAGAASENGALWSSYTNGLATGTLSLTAPTAPGSYEFRYHVDDGFAVAAQTGIITVSAAAPSRHVPQVSVGDKPGISPPR